MNAVKSVIEMREGSKQNGGDGVKKERVRGKKGIKAGGAEETIVGSVKREIPAPLI